MKKNRFRQLAIESVKHINWNLYFALLVMGLCPTIYTTVRTFFLGQMPGEWSYSIAGQLTWVNLLYEIINEAIILPLFYFIGTVTAAKKEFTNRLKTGLLFSLIIYSILAVIIFVYAEPLLYLMATSKDIIRDSASYIRIESIANIFSIMVSFVSVSLIAIGNEKQVYTLTGIRLLLCVISDTFLVSSLPFSAKLGVNGIGISNIIVNACLLAVSFVMLNRSGYKILNRSTLSFAWIKGFLSVGSISGLESLVRNAAYILMVSRMVNMVGEQGTYWVANNFIWGWLLLPVLQLGELIKKETSNDENAVKNNTLGYFTVTAIICLLWIVLIPVYNPFLHYVMNYSDFEKLFDLVMVLLGFYVLFAFQNVIDMVFYGRGRTGYMLFESVVTNTLYYGTAFILYLKGVWTPSLMGIALMFGIGNAFDSVVSVVAFIFFLKRHRINITDIT